MTHLWRIAVLPALIASVAVPAAWAADGRSWASVETATIRPGVQTFTQGGQCTANFVFFDRAATYIGQAAHCSSTGDPTQTNGCTAPSLPIGTKVTVTGASRPATMVYNSWLTMQSLGETNPDTCRSNDFALLRLDAADVAKVNPTVPFWGGPVGLNRVGTTFGQQVYSYGSSELRLGLTLLSPKRGISLGDVGSVWSHQVSTVTPGIPGDSGSAFLDPAGRALGVLSTVQIGLPGGVSNGVGDLAHELDYLHARTRFTAVALALGTLPFNGNRLPLAIG